jgi:hypothetical protein
MSGAGTERRGGSQGAMTVARTPASWWIVLGLATFVTLYALAYVIIGPPIYPPQLADSFRARPWGIYPHAFFGAVAMLLGPLQVRARPAGAPPQPAPHSRQDLSRLLHGRRSRWPTCPLTPSAG